MTADRFRPLDDALQRHIDQGLLPGAVALVHRRGETVHAAALGARAPGADPMALDTLFRIYSMTKPIVSLAAVMLAEQGRLLLSQPVAHWLPAFADQQVRTADGRRVPAGRPATVHDLLRHTAGLSYAWDAGPVQDDYQAARLGARDLSNARQAAALGALPLVHQPGGAWEYSRATDVLGAVLEAVCQESLGVLLQRMVLGPLGMHETAFHIPPERRGRLAEPFAADPQTGAPIALLDATRAPVFESGGGGLVSTAADYARFLSLLLGQGALGDVRLAGRKTVAWMTADHLGTIPVAGAILPAGYGFGLGVAVRRADGLAARQGSAGSYGWSGMAGTVFFVDPSEEMFGILLTQAPGMLDALCDLFPNLVYGAL
ncbi:serine hydrolase [Xylophilus sp. Leaf220]|uniref:serine hydrolase domain-containing protein n=1 Tax=Xylophilus sp. Leaf220 TaxID=1735686 RepID=UPI0006F53A6C|nr:serine hydrolase domain-containing protein [Xylophilus sp. Leaf220]KQM80424.1 serine hydrolase [Xylophilus sp. Leaf220]